MKSIYIIKLMANVLHFPIRKRVKGRLFLNKVVVLDFNNLEGCTLYGCQLVYFGIGSLSLVSSRMEKCKFVFSGPAANALQFIKLVGDCDPRIISETFKDALSCMRSDTEKSNDHS